MDDGRKMLIDGRNKKYAMALKEMKSNEEPLTGAKQVAIYRINWHIRYYHMAKASIWSSFGTVFYM